MDTQYLKMIMALPDEFFEGWEWQAGDKAIVNNNTWTVFGGNTNGMVVIGEDLKQFSIGKLDFSYKIGDEARPIPSQEQLLKISKLDWDLYYYDLLKRYSDYDTAEQAGLAMIMYTKYAKKWNGESWV